MVGELAFEGGLQQGLGLTRLYVLWCSWGVWGGILDFQASQVCVGGVDGGIGGGGLLFRSRAGWVFGFSVDSRYLVLDGGLSIQWGFWLLRRRFGILISRYCGVAGGVLWGIRSFQVSVMWTWAWGIGGVQGRWVFSLLQVSQAKRLWVQMLWTFGFLAFIRCVSARAGS